MKVLQGVALAMLVGCAGAPAYAQELFVRRAEVPQYPGLALQAGLVATIRVTVTVKKGAVSDATALTGTPSVRGFHQSTLANIRTWGVADQAATKFITAYSYELTHKRTDL